MNKKTTIKISRGSLCRLAGCVMVVAALLLPGCGTKKQTPAKGGEKKVERTKDDVSGFRTLSMDKTTFTILNASGHQTSLNGSIRIARDSIIICSIMPFPGVKMEFARLAINKQGITVMDRINKKYFSMTFAEAQKVYGMAMNYNTFESIFTNRVFIYKFAYVPLISDFEVSNVGGQTMLTYVDKRISQEFYFDAARVLQGGMIASGQQYSMRWNYSDFAVYNNVNFPKRMTLKIAGPDFHRQATIQYKEVELDRDRNFEFNVPSSYQKVTLDELLSPL